LGTDANFGFMFRSRVVLVLLKTLNGNQPRENYDNRDAATVSIVPATLAEVQQSKVMKPPPIYIKEAFTPPPPERCAAPL
jgi:hypothetical protein